jgi:hypothetical protein
MKSVILNGQEITIGSKVRFIDDRELYPNSRDSIKIPKLGEVYTVRGFTDVGGFYLEEIKNTYIKFVNSKNEVDSVAEPGFGIKRFEVAQPLRKKKIVQIEILPIVEERLEITRRKVTSFKIDKIYQS